MAMFKTAVGVTLVIALNCAGAQSPPDADAAQVVRITGARQTPTGESARVYAAKQSALKGTLAFKCALDSVYASPQDDAELAIQQRQALTPGEVGDAGAPMPLSNPRKFSGSAPDNDVVNMAESSSIPGVGTGDTMGPCDVADRKSASARESIIRHDKIFAEALAALDARDYDKAAALLQAAYKKIAYPEAAVLLAKLSLSGQGMPRDTDKALDWLNRAAVGRFDAGRVRMHFNPKDPEAFNGMIEGALLLARLHMAGTDGVNQDTAEARKWYAKAAELGYVPALHALGLASQAGVGGSRDIVQARAYFQEAADEGYVPSQYALARLYDLGDGVPPDQAKAFAYYKAAALKGHPDALSALALYFYEGEQVPKNLATARQLLNQAAMRGQSEAMFNLAVMSANGEGGSKDLGMAYVWFSLAKASGHQRAGLALDGISKNMSPQDHATADAILKPRTAAPASGGG